MPGEGKSMVSFIVVGLDAADKLIADAKRKESKEYYQDKELAFRDLSEQNLARLQADDDPTDAEIDEMQERNVRVFGKEDPALAKFRKQTHTAEDRAALKENLDSSNAYTNSLTLGSLLHLFLSKTLRDTYMPIAQAQAKAREDNSDYKKQYEMLGEGSKLSLKLQLVL